MVQCDAGEVSADVSDGGGVVKKIASISAAARAPEAANRARLCGALREACRYRRMVMRIRVPGRGSGCVPGRVPEYLQMDPERLVKDQIIKISGRLF